VFRLHPRRQLAANRCWSLTSARPTIATVIKGGPNIRVLNWAACTNARRLLFPATIVTLPNFLASSAPLATNQFQLDKKQSLLTQQINLLFSLLLAHNPPTAIGQRILGYPPRPHAILFVITRSLVHDGRPVRIPKWRSFIIKIENPLRLGRECAESRTSRKIEGDYVP
jgi:hypothetical protein